MPLKEIVRSISKKLLFIILGIIVVGIVLYFIWQHNKYRIVNNKIADTVAQQTDSLYVVKYDSLHFDIATGQAYLKNIHIEPDTNIIKKTKLEDLPYILLDITIKSIKVTGVKTDKAVIGAQMLGDSVVIDQPDVLVYFLKPLQKQTNINTEATNIYKEILGNLKRIQVGDVFINNIRASGIGYFDKEKEFTLGTSNIHLADVLIDSASNYDTSRTLFCKQAILNIASFISYNNGRPEIRVSNVNYSGKGKALTIGGIVINRFEADNGDSIKLLRATGLGLIGLNTNEIVKNKNIVVDSIDCSSITLYEPPAEKLKTAGKKKPAPADTTGFKHVYSIDMKHLGFPKVNFVSAEKSNYKLGNISIKINEVKADEIMELQDHPIDFTKEAEISCDKISLNTKDGLYNCVINNTTLNSLQKQLDIGSISMKPFLGEKAFANKAHFQKDRYDLLLTGIALKNIDMKNLLDKKIFASNLTVANTSLKIYRDLTKPLSKKSKVGNYPSQLLLKSAVPVNIADATLSNVFIRYKEHEKVSDSSGVVTFENSSLHISNITNVDTAISHNKAATVSFSSSILGEIPVKGQFIFYLTGNGGNFAVNGHVSGFDALALNKVSVPMALIRLNTGTINGVDFKFKGNDSSAKGDFAMKYENLKVDVLKEDKDSKEIKKKGLKSLLANVIIKNNNPDNGDLREKNPEYDRDIHKSFFNLVWKTIFTGMKETLGLP
ncbi:MAG TPA: hypothetical protein VIJ92_10235 [Ginsengibacter sp.]